MIPQYSPSRRLQQTCGRVLNTKEPLMYEIRLIIDRQGDAYTAHWIEP